VPKVDDLQMTLASFDQSPATADILSLSLFAPFAENVEIWIDIFREAFVVLLVFSRVHAVGRSVGRSLITTSTRLMAIGLVFP